jgi:hypothetical protein
MTSDKLIPPHANGQESSGITVNIAGAFQRQGRRDRGCGAASRIGHGSAAGDDVLWRWRIGKSWLCGGCNVA